MSETPAKLCGQEPVLSIVVPCHNSATHLPLLLDSLSEQEGSTPWEVIVVDNRSTDATADTAASYADRLALRVVKATGRAGAAYAMNMGAAAARGTALVFIGSDDEAAPGFVEAVALAVRKHDVVAPRLDRKTLNSESALGFLPFAEELLQHDHLPDTFGFLPFAWGSGLGMTRDAFRAVGGFDLDLPTGEDIDLAWRLQLAGFSLELEPSAVLRYRFRRDALGLYRQAREHAVGHVALYIKFGRYGMPRKGICDVLRDWGWLLGQIPRRPTRSNWAYWLNMLGFRVGRIKGSVRYRVFYL
jgi:glycosyltransferase involved in cell wall biosynthesis